MKKIQTFLLLSILSIITFILIHDKAYYYGLVLDKTIISEKLPDFIRPKFSGSDLGNNGFYLIQKNTTIHVIDNRSKISTQLEHEIQVKNIKGYGFFNEKIILKVNTNNETVYYLDISYNKNRGYLFNEVKRIPKEYKYINLEKDLTYFKLFNKVKLMSLVTSIIFILFLIKAIYFHCLHPHYP
mgnify:CR=1 FL=1|tara:strand:+ start:14 stop:565 length:552 start_codon:yes stop_codon:yes gene_type:complete